jgi:hypothetical protein
MVRRRSSRGGYTEARRVPNPQQRGATSRAGRGDVAGARDGDPIKFSLPQASATG